MVTISAINTLIVAAAVPVRHRFSVLIALARSLLAHVIEVWIFAIGFFTLLVLDGFGALAGNLDGGLLDCVYLSFNTYTTHGTGDIRFLVGLEGLTGFLASQAPSANNPDPSYWARFLVRDDSSPYVAPNMGNVYPDWSRIIVAGHSQGGGHAPMLAMNLPPSTPARRVVMFSAPTTTPATWKATRPPPG